MKKNQHIFLFTAVGIFFSCGKEPATSQSAKILTIKSVDASFIPEIRLAGIITKNINGQPEDMLVTFKNAGINTIRLRIWKTPVGGHSGFDEVKTLSNEIKNKGMKVWLTVHYSDTWADPGSQVKPAEWNTASFAQLKDSVYNYTKKIVTEINPDYIQIGNEINNGMLWPDGSYNNPAQLTGLLQQGIKAVRDNAANTKIMLHYAGVDNAVPFFKNFNTLDYDIIALSYYPNWHGKNLANVQTRLNTLDSTFNKEIVIGETSYPFTFGFNDYTNNVIGSQDQVLTEYPATVQGQKDFLIKIKQIVTNVPKAIGFCYWGAEWIGFKGSTATDGSSWENQALWDFNNQALPAMEVFKD
jgi:arabinogalactan endo-1,4-beta-galactosidase